MRALHVCSFHDGFYFMRSPLGGQSVYFEDSDRFGPSKFNPRNGDIIGFIPEKLKWFWDWYPKWLELGRPCSSTRSVPYGEVRTVFRPEDVEQ